MKVYLVWADVKESNYHYLAGIYAIEKKAYESAKELQEEASIEVKEYYVQERNIIS